MKRSVSHRPSRVAVRLTWLALVVMVVALTGASSRAQQGQGRGPTRQLFEPRGETVADGPDGRVDRTRKRGRRVRVDTGALQQADAQGGADERDAESVRRRAVARTKKHTRAHELRWMGVEGPAARRRGRGYLRDPGRGRGGHRLCRRQGVRGSFLRARTSTKSTRSSRRSFRPTIRTPISRRSNPTRRPRRWTRRWLRRWPATPRPRST